MELDDPEMAQMLLEEMEEKEEQLRLAAEFGQTLLERTEELQEENEEMEREKEAAVAAAEEHEYRTQELEANLGRLADEASEKDAALSTAREDLAKMELEMEQRIKDMEGSDAEKEEAAARAQAEVAAAKEAAAAEIARLEEQAREIREKEEETRNARDIEERERIEAQKQQKAAEKQLKAAEDKMTEQKKRMEEVSAKMEEEKARAEKVAAEMERKHQEMLDMQNQMAEMQRQLEVANELSAQKAAAGAPSSIEFEGVEQMGGSLFDDLADTMGAEDGVPAPEPEPAQLPEGVPPESGPSNSATPRSMDAIKEQAEHEARAAANQMAKDQMAKEKERLRQEYEEKLAAATAAQGGEGDTVDVTALKSEMEEKFKAEQEKAAADSQVEYERKKEAEMESMMQQMREEAAAEMERQLAARERQKEYEMRLKQVSKAMELDKQDQTEAIELLKQVNVEMMEASAALKQQTKQKLVSEEQLAKIAKKIGKPGEKLDAADLAKTVEGMSVSVFDNFAKLSEEEKAEMLGNLEVVKKGTIKAGASNQRVRRGSQMVQQALQKQMAEDSELASLMEQGQGVLSGSGSPADVITALKENAQFVTDVKKLVCTYVQEAVTTAKIPTVDAQKDWGRYEIADLSVAEIAIDPNKLVLTVDKSVKVQISNLRATFDTFRWVLEKTTTPKINDKGTGTATMSGFSVVVSFDIVSDAETGLGVKFEPPVVSLESLDVKVNDCKNEWIFNKLLKWCKTKVQDAVVKEIQTQAEEKVDTLAAQLSTLIATIS